MLRTTHKWPGASACWQWSDGRREPVFVGLDAVDSDWQPQHLPAWFAQAIGAEPCAGEAEYRAAVDRATLNV